MAISLNSDTCGDDNAGFGSCPGEHGPVARAEDEGNAAPGGLYYTFYFSLSCFVLGISLSTIIVAYVRDYSWNVGSSSRIALVGSGTAFSSSCFSHAAILYRLCRRTTSGLHRRFLLLHWVVFDFFLMRWA
jgi:hypothetical protein